MFGLPMLITQGRCSCLFAYKYIHVYDFPGEEIWVEDSKKVWALASLVSQHNTILKVKRQDTGELVDIDLVRRAAWFEFPGWFLSYGRS